VYTTAQSAHAWPSLPFFNKKQANPDDDKPPPGMTDVEDEDSTPSEFEKDEKRPDKKASKDDDGAEKSEKPKLDSWDSDPEFHYRSAKRYVERGEYRDALLQINKALTLNKNFWPARFLGAYVFQLEGRFPESIARYRDYLQHKPDDQQAHVNLGAVLRHEGKFDEAEDEYRKAIDLNFYSLQAHYNLANLLIERNDLEEALKELHACEKIAPTNAWVHNNLGVIYQKRDYQEEAEQEFSKAANLEPANKTFELNLGLIRDQIAAKRKQAKGPLM
jgi:Flp pilus assembly protein TadD